MTRHDFLVKWGVYALALLPVWLLETYVFARLPLFGVRPMLLPLAVAAVSVLEGAAAGAGFGLGVGALAVACGGAEAWQILVMMAAGLGTGLLSQYLLRQDLLGCLLCSALNLAAVDGVRIVVRLLAGSAGLEPMLRLAGAELLCSLLFVFPVYGIFLWVFRRVPKSTHF